MERTRETARKYVSEHDLSIPNNAALRSDILGMQRRLTARSYPGFTFGDSFAQIKARCEALGPRKEGSMPRFYADPQGRYAACAEVRPGKAYMPALASLTLVLDEHRVVSIATELPMPQLMEYARQIARGERAEVEGTHFCRTFADGVGGVCVDLETKILLLTLGK